MINLIPSEERKKIVMDFNLRVLSLFFIMLSFSFLVLSVMILPSYFIILEDEKIIENKIKLQENEPLPIADQNVLSIINDLEMKLTLLEKIKGNKNVFSEKILNEIIFKKISGIKITEIFYQNDLKGGQKINISGKASNREILLSFRRLLEDNPAFSKVDLPVSNFIKGSNINFYLSLIPS